MQINPGRFDDPINADEVSYGNGTVKDALDNMSAEGVAHNGIYRGKYLGDSVTAEQWSQISSGKFDDLYIGDYWTINGVNWRIAHFDYWLHTGDTECTTHHVLIVPDSNLYTAQMNTSDVATGGYYNSVMRGGANYPSGGNLASAVTTVTSAFGASHLLTHRNLLANTISGDNASNWAWYDSCVELMNEVQVYGCPAWSVGGKGYEVGIDKEQLALFRLDHSKITNRSVWWLRSVASSAIFCYVSSDGVANFNGASGSFGVRPVFAII